MDMQTEIPATDETQKPDSRGHLRLVDIERTTPVDPFPTLEERPCWRVYDEGVQHDGKRRKAGVYWHDKKEQPDGVATYTDVWVCAPLHVEAVTSNPEDGEYGRLLRFRSTNGRWKQWGLPMTMLAGDGREVLSVLLDEGLDVDYGRRREVCRYIAGQHPKKRLRGATTTGWYGQAFVLPGEVIGADDIWFQASGRYAPYGVAGTFEGWRDGVAAMAVGNPQLMLAICAGLAGPLLQSLNLTGSGIHLHGDSSTGKTTALYAAISAWGGPTYARTWRATSNGLEGAARMHTDTLLALDEIGEVAPKDLYESIYALGNGSGKTRATVHGEARRPARWRVALLSTGEVTASGRMAVGGFDAKAGQAVRVLDIPVSGTSGIFDNLHGYASGAALSQAVRNAAAQHYGHAGPAFVRALLAEDQEDPAQHLARLLPRFGETEGQEGRAAQMLAVCAVAGEIATVGTIVPWTRGAATSAAVKAFHLWRGARGAAGKNAEHAAILGAVADFIDRHGDSRFSSLADITTQVRDRAGYWKDDDGRRLYLFTSGGLGEATKGHDIGRVTRALDEAGAITDRDLGKKSKKIHIPGQGGKKSRLYHIDPEKLGEDHS